MAFNGCIILCSETHLGREGTSFSQDLLFANVRIKPLKLVGELLGELLRFRPLTGKQEPAKLAVLFVFPAERSTAASAKEPYSALQKDSN
jgi:hypothetical protein